MKKKKVLLDLQCRHKARVLDIKMQSGVRAETWEEHKFPSAGWKNKLRCSYNRITR